MHIQFAVWASSIYDHIFQENKGLTRLDLFQVIS